MQRHKSQRSSQINDLTLEIRKKIENVSGLPCLFTGPNKFWAGQFFCARPKIYLRIVAVTNTFCARQKDDLHSVKLVFGPAQ